MNEQAMAEQGPTRELSSKLGVVNEMLFLLYRIKIGLK